MPTIVTATELRTILGVSSSLYSDAYLGDIVDASENLVLPMLVTFQSIEGVDFAVTPYRLSKNLLAKVTGLLGPYLDVETMVG
jgi:hypothetical protein